MPAHYVSITRQLKPENPKESLSYPYANTMCQHKTAREARESQIVPELPLWQLCQHNMAARPRESQIVPDLSLCQHIMPA